MHHAICCRDNMGFDSSFHYEVESRNMIGFLMYCGAVLAALLLFMFYRPSEEKQEQIVDPRYRIHRKNQREYIFFLKSFYVFFFSKTVFF